MTISICSLRQVHNSSHQNIEELAKQPPSVAFPLPPGGAPPSAVVTEKCKKNWDSCDAPNGFNYFHRAMRIPNMCLVLKLDNGKMISIADQQNHRQTDKATQSRISIKISLNFIVKQVDTVLSSANTRYLKRPDELGRSLIQIRKISGPKSDP